jgi:hypothetical protein
MGQSCKAPRCLPFQPGNFLDCRPIANVQCGFCDLELAQIDSSNFGMGPRRGIDKTRRGAANDHVRQVFGQILAQAAAATFVVAAVATLQAVQHLLDRQLAIGGPRHHNNRGIDGDRAQPQPRRQQPLPVKVDLNPARRQQRCGIRAALDTHLQLVDGQLRAGGQPHGADRQLHPAAGSPVCQRLGHLAA